MLSAEDNQLLTRFGDPIGRVPSLRAAAPARPWRSGAATSYRLTGRCRPA